jgi:pantoate--beta-alanine ligase
VTFRVVTAILEMQEISDRIRQEGKRIAVVPTMGYLHRGHTSLIERARTLADAVVTTIFVNPTQFAPNEDFEQYPRDLARDRTLAREAGTDIIFAPDTREMYPTGFSTYVEVEGASNILEGKFRPMHFRGVTTVVAKLFHIVRPHVALFGQKDAQQAFIIRKMTKDLNIDTSIVVAPIVREPDGLALSSRNIYLSESERKNALVLFEALQYAVERVRSGERECSELRSEMERRIRTGSPRQIDYIAFVRPATFEEIDTIEPPEVLIALAARFGSTRLIDNILIAVEEKRGN